MKRVSGFALALLCATALSSMSAQAATMTLGGSALNVAPTPFYGNTQNTNNVVVGDTSVGGYIVPTGVLIDPTVAGNGNNLNSATTPWLKGATATFTGVGEYAVRWFYVGSESGFTDSFSATGVGPFAESNKNNNVTAVHSAPVLMGISFNSLAFTFDWTHPVEGAKSVSNGSPNLPGDKDGSLIFSWAAPTGGFNSNGEETFDLTKTAPDDSATNFWFAFALNDSGARTADGNGTDDNHDDFIVLANVILRGDEQFPTPIPGALPLFGTVLGGGLLYRKLRNRRKQAAA